MKQYYNIAGHIICIESDNTPVIEEIIGFSVFKTEQKSDDICIRLETSSPDKEEEKQSYYTVKTDVATCSFLEGPLENHLLIKQDESIKLSLCYNKSNYNSIIRGDLKPVFLRFALWIAFNLSVIQYRTVAIHSSCILYKGKAILYIGESGAGKSTHTRLVHQYFPEATLLNDDSPIIRIKDKECTVYGSPWSGKNPCYKQQKAKLWGIVRIHQSKENRISKLPLHEAIGTLLPSFPPELYLNRTSQDHIFRILSDILEQVPVFSLECLPDEDAAKLSIASVLNG